MPDRMRKCLSVVLAWAMLLIGVPVSASGGHGEYVVKNAGGSIDAPVGDDVTLDVESGAIIITARQQYLGAQTNGQETTGPRRPAPRTVLARITPAQVTDLSYGSEVHHRIGAGIAWGVVSLGVGLIVGFSKATKHYIGITWEADGKKGGLAFEAKKGEYLGIINALQTVTGKKAVDTDAPGIAGRLGVTGK